MQGHLLRVYLHYRVYRCLSSHPCKYVLNKPSFEYPHCRVIYGPQQCNYIHPGITATRLAQTFLEVYQGFFSTTLAGVALGIVLRYKCLFIEPLCRSIFTLSVHLAEVNPALYLWLCLQYELQL